MEPGGVKSAWNLVGSSQHGTCLRFVSFAHEVEENSSRLPGTHVLGRRIICPFSTGNLPQLVKLLTVNCLSVSMVRG